MAAAAAPARARQTARPVRLRADPRGPRSPGQEASHAVEDHPPPQTRVDSDDAPVGPAGQQPIAPPGEPDEADGVHQGREAAQEKPVRAPGALAQQLCTVAIPARWRRFTKAIASPFGLVVRPSVERLDPHPRLVHAQCPHLNEHGVARRDSA